MASHLTNVRGPTRYSSMYRVEVGTTFGTLLEPGLHEIPDREIPDREIPHREIPD